MKQAIKKGSSIKKKGGLSAWKEKSGMSITEGKVDLSVSNANKPQSWIVMPKAFAETTGLIGIPENTVVSVLGHSNVGKSTLVNHAITSAQRQGLIPVIIDTENAFSFQYAMNMGFEAEPVYGDVEVEEIDTETGEFTVRTENQVVYWDGNFIYYNNKLLCERFGDMDYAQGKRVSKKRKTAVIEDVAACINELLDAQENGEIEQGFLFVWDSVGSIGSFKEYSAGKIGNPMWSAAAVSSAFNLIVNDRIPSSKKQTSKYNNTFLYINKIWLDPMSNPVGPAIMTPKCGKSLRYSTRLEFVLGSQLTAGIRRLTATSKGVNYSYAIETKIKVQKNHLDAPNNVCYEGKLIACDLGFISLSDLDKYKKEHISTILKELNKRLSESGSPDVITENDVVFQEEEDDVTSE